MRLFKFVTPLMVVLLTAAYLCSSETMTKPNPISETGLAAAGYPSTYLPATTLPALDSFVKSIANGNAEEIVGVYVPGTLALPTVQQPSNNPNFVSREPETITQFHAASRFQTIGLLAHNYLAGEHFYDMQMFQTVIVIYGNGKLAYYQIVDIQKYQALTPTSPQSDFVDLNGASNSHLSASELFDRVYARGDRVVFQTCILNNGNPSWGRMFIIATPMEMERTTFQGSPVRAAYPAVF